MTTHDRKKPTSLEQQINDLRSRVSLHETTIKQMQSVGGFADSKLLGMRSKRLEDRVAVLEAKLTLADELIALMLGALREHLIDRHDADSARDNDMDVLKVRKAMRLLGNIGWPRNVEQQDVLDSQRRESKLRPSPIVASAST